MIHNSTFGDFYESRLGGAAEVGVEDEERTEAAEEDSKDIR